jgi:hypothetical protein
VREEYIMNLPVYALRSLQALFQRASDSQGQRGSSFLPEAARPRRFRPGLEPLDPRVLLSAGRTGLLQPPTAEAHLVREATAPVPITALDGTYQVAVFHIPGGIVGFQVEANNGQIIAPPTIDDVTVIQRGQVSIIKENLKFHSVSLHISGWFIVSSPEGFARGTYKGQGTYFLENNEVRWHGNWETEAGRRFFGSWRAERIAV